MTIDPVRAIGVIGAGHSGTTIVYRMLALHPDATWFSQYSRQALMGAPGVGAASRIIDRLLRRRVPHDWNKVQSASGWRRIVPTPIEGAGLWDVLMDGAGQPVARIRSTLLAACAAAGTSTVIVKPPGRYRSRCAPLVSAAFPDSRYVHVARDGRAVALSVLRKWRKGPARGDALLARASEHWLRALGQIRAYERALPVAVIHYEALCADVWGQLRRALEFSGLDPDRFPFARVPRILKSTNEARLRQAAPDELAALNRLLADGLQRYGYTRG